jgi:heme/copper-type cytochrome/quinol oxidase subunit 2
MLTALQIAGLSVAMLIVVGVVWIIAVMFYVAWKLERLRMDQEENEASHETHRL